MLNKRHRYPFTALALAGLFFAGLAGSAWAQPQDNSKESVAEAARRAREKKKAAAQPAKTFTNDDSLFTPAADSGDKSAPANPAQGADNGASPSAANGKPADAKTRSDHAANAADLERTKKDLAQAEGELDVMQRKFKLDSESYYSKTDFAGDTVGKASLDSEAQDIVTKQESVAKIKARVADLQALVDAAAPAASESKPASEEKPPSP